MKDLDIMSIKPEDCVRWALRDLGKEINSDGHWNHKIQAALYHLIPKSLFVWGNKHIVIPDIYAKRISAK